MPYEFTLRSGDLDVVFFVEVGDEIGGVDFGYFGEEGGDRELGVHGGMFFAKFRDDVVNYLGA